MFVLYCRRAAGRLNSSVSAHENPLLLFDRLNTLLLRYASQAFT